MHAKSPKRGVSENAFQLGQQLELLAPGVTWYYNWGNVASTGYQSQVINSTALEYVPMCWNGYYSADKICEYCQDHPEVKYLLGFNEPNFTAQANLTPAEAAALWPEVQALAKELGLKLVAPALNYSPNPPYTDPCVWMDEFVALVGSDAFDYTAVHNYGGLGVMKTIAGNFYDRYGKPVWVTEFCYWPDEGNSNAKVEPAVQCAKMIETVEWLEKTDWIYRYAWFKAVGAVDNSISNNPCYGLIIPSTGSGDRELSQQGWTYVYLPDYDSEAYWAVGETVSATEFYTSKSLLIDKGSYEQCPKPVEISQFNAGAYADYLFEVAEGDEYVLQVTVSGVGEPTRFDPTLAVSTVDADGNATVVSPAQQFTISGDNAVYTTHEFPLELAAGRHTLRLADANPYAPSGIRISTLRLVDANAGLDLVHRTPYPVPCIYVDLMGRPVANPIPGTVYLQRRDGNVNKVVY